MERPVVAGEEIELARPARVMAVGTVLSRITGLGRIAAMTFALGVVESRLADTYNIANTIPNVIYELVLGGVLTSVFIPLLVEQIRGNGGENPGDSPEVSGVSAMVSVALAILMAVSLLAAVAAPWIMRVFTFRVAGEAGEIQQVLATFFFRFFAFQIVLYGYSSIADGLLNAYNKFAVPMFAPIVNNLVVIGVFIAFGVIYDVSEVSTWGGPGLLLALGTTAGVGGMALVHWPFVRRLPLKLRLNLDFGHPAVRKLARLSGWSIGYVVVNQIGFGVSLILANGFQGGPTAYFVAFAFFQLPYGIVAVSIMTALVPTLSAYALEGKMREFGHRVARGLRATAALLLPATAAFIALALPAIELLLERGVMSADSSEVVARVLQMFAIGILPFSLWLLFLRCFYSMQDARTPFLLNLFEVGITIVLDFPLYHLWKVPGLALAHSLGYVFGCLAAGVVLARRVGNLEWRENLIAVAKIGAASLAAGVTMWVVAAAISGAALEIGAGGGLGGMVFLGVAWLLRAELDVYKRLISRGEG